MFDYLQIGIVAILLSTLTIVLCGIVYYGYAQRNRDRRTSRKLSENIAGVAVVILCVTLVVTALSAISLWHIATTLPFEYQSAVKTVSEIKGLLNRNNASIGDGLESLQLKQSIKEAIKEKNDLRAELLSWLYNPLMPYKDTILERLPPDFFESA